MNETNQTTDVPSVWDCLDDDQKLRAIVARKRAVMDEWNKLEIQQAELQPESDQAFYIFNICSNGHPQIFTNYTHSRFPGKHMTEASQVVRDTIAKALRSAVDEIKAARSGVVTPKEPGTIVERVEAERRVEDAVKDEIAGVIHRAFHGPSKAAQ